MTQLVVPLRYTGFAETAQVFQQTMNSQLVLIMAVIATVSLLCHRLELGVSGAGTLQFPFQPNFPDKDHTIN